MIIGCACAIFGKKTDRFFLWLIDLFNGMPHLILLVLISILVGNHLALGADDLADLVHGDVDGQDARGRGGHLVGGVDGPGHDVEDVEAGVAGLTTSSGKYFFVTWFHRESLPILPSPFSPSFMVEIPLLSGYDKR